MKVSKKCLAEAIDNSEEKAKPKHMRNLEKNSSSSHGAERVKADFPSIKQYIPFCRASVKLWITEDVKIWYERK